MSLFAKGISRGLPMVRNLGSSIFKKGMNSGGLAHTIFRKGGDLLGSGRRALSTISNVLDNPMADVVAKRVGVDLGNIKRGISSVDSGLGKAQNIHRFADSRLPGLRTEAQGIIKDAQNVVSQARQKQNEIKRGYDNAIERIRREKEMFNTQMNAEPTLFI